MSSPKSDFLYSIY